MASNLLFKRPRMAGERFPTAPGAIARPHTGPHGPLVTTPIYPIHRSKSDMESIKPNYKCTTYVLRIPNTVRPRTSGRPQSRLAGQGNEPRERMEDAEKRVLKRRKSHLAEHIEVTDEFLERMVKLGLLTPEMAVIVDAEKSNLGKVSRIIDLLLAVNDDKTFTTLCEMLTSDYQWLVRDLEAEIRMERGDVEPAADTLQESGMLVHRKFGNNKRISQTDKREFTELMAQKLQIAREEWGREMDKLKTDYLAEKHKNETLESKSRLMAKQLGDFYKRHENQLTWHAHDMTTTSKALQNLTEESQKDALTKLYEGLVKFYDKVGKMLNHRESLLDERIKCLKMFKIPNEEVSLDHALRMALQMKEEGDAASVAQDKDQQRTIKRLNKRISDLEQEITSMEDKIISLEEALNKKHAKGRTPRS